MTTNDIMIYSTYRTVRTDHIDCDCDEFVSLIMSIVHHGHRWFTSCRKISHKTGDKIHIHTEGLA